MRLVHRHSHVRRRLLGAGVALPAVLLLPRGLAAAPPTPACGDASPTPKQFAGPFYTPDSPEKADFRADDPDGTPVLLSAEVLDTQCRPVAGAIVDLWHADSDGRYDNDGFRLRGRQRVDDAGAAQFKTIRPSQYYGRTPHYHARIFGPGGRRLLTTQLYFPGQASNERDGLFRPELLMAVEVASPGLEARFTFIVDAA